MLLKNKKMPINQTGFSLIEILVGLVIGLLVTLIIMQVFGTFEGQKRSTMGSADAQTNGSIALFTIQRDIQMAGFGLPVFDTRNPPLRCNPSPTVNHDSNGATPNIDMFPLFITDGGTAAGASDRVAIRYASDGASAKSGIPVRVVSFAGLEAEVANNLGCNNNDVVMISAGATCAMTRVNDADLDVVPRTETTHITLLSAAGAAEGSSLSCMGRWNQFEYRVVNNQLQRNDASSVAATPIVSDIVNIQAQYGISAAANNNQITNWVNASAPWAIPTVAERNRIKSVHIVIVARNGLLEKENVTNTCTTAKGTVNNGPCAWDDTNLPTAAPKIDLSNDANWQRYRYRVYETIFPLRNMVWSSSTLE